MVVVVDALRSQSFGENSLATAIRSIFRPGTFFQARVLGAHGEERKREMGMCNGMVTMSLTRTEKTSPQAVHVLAHDRERTDRSG